uniref:PIN domain-containing protein n=1 Tax=Clastoptera arizonana TaxID=38151 RepID=A0A1B6DID1_9HEMI
MITKKVFLKKTKRGNILKIVREHYLRDDIYCGSYACDKCNDNNKILSTDPDSDNILFDMPHYLILDTNVILNQIDVLEEPTLCNVIVLQTVLEEVKHRSSSVYKRLKEIIADSRRNFYVFVNEHHRETYVERIPGEKINDRNDRAIRVAANWYDNHLNQSSNQPKEDRISIVLLSDDVENRKHASTLVLNSCSAEDYVRSLKNAPMLEDKLSARNFSSEGKTALFPTHLTPVQIHEGIKAGKVLQGSFQASRENFLEGFVNVEGYEKPILVQGREGLNRAVDGDNVAIELLPEEEWSAPSEIVLQDDETVDTGDVGDDEEELQKTKNKPIEKQPTGRIVGIIRRKWRQYCGILQANPVRGVSPIQISNLQNVHDLT